MSKHRSSKRPVRKRTKTCIVGVVALSLSGAAYSAHATFGKAHLGSGEVVASDGVITARAQTVDVAPPPPQHGTSWWPRPTTSSPTTSAPSTTSPTTTAAPTTTPTTSATTTTPSTTSPSPTSGGSAFPGLVSGQFYLGMSCGTACSTQEALLNRDYGLHRQYKNWGNWSGVAKAIQEDQREGRLPWISIKGPGGGPSGWRALANGSYDADIRGLAATLKANDDRPVFITFHHEPSNDGTDADGASWAAAYCHLHDVLSQLGALANVADPPILGDWLFNPRNSQDPAKWLTSGVMHRMPFLGVDMYENSSGETYALRIPRIINWMAVRGYHKMVGIGETGATDYYGGTTAVQWMNASLNWVAANTDKVVAVSYFNSMVNSRAGVYWPLDETWAKMTAYRNWLASTKTID